MQRKTQTWINQVITQASVASVGKRQKPIWAKDQERGLWRDIGAKTSGRMKWGLQEPTVDRAYVQGSLRCFWWLRKKSSSQKLQTLVDETFQVLCGQSLSIWEQFASLGIVQEAGTREQKYKLFTEQFIYLLCLNTQEQSSHKGKKLFGACSGMRKSKVMHWHLLSFYPGLMLPYDMAESRRVSGCMQETKHGGGRFHYMTACCHGSLPNSLGTELIPS
jgi:hypothetical protein